MLPIILLLAAEPLIDLASIDVTGTIACEQHIANAMDSKPLVEAIVASGCTSCAEVEGAIAFRKFQGERVVLDRRDKPEAGESFGLHTRTHTISNLPDYPGKTFYGCSYPIEPTDRNGKPC